MLNSTNTAPGSFIEGFGKVNIVGKRGRQHKWAAEVINIEKLGSESCKYWKVTGL